MLEKKVKEQRELQEQLEREKQEVNDFIKKERELDKSEKEQKVRQIQEQLQIKDQELYESKANYD